MQHTIRTAIIKHSAKTNGHHTVVSGFSRAAEPIIVIALFGAALVLRLWALGWGLPYVEHPDEPAVLETAVRMVKEGEPNPGRFIYPSFYYYMLALVIRLHTVWGIAQGLYQSLADLPEKTYLYTVAPELYRWSRALTALLGALTIPLVYVLGRQMCDQRVGLISGSGLAVCMYHVQHSHFVTTDVPTGLWTTLAVAGAWGIATQGRWRNYMIGGVATGLAAGTKYNAGIVGIALGVAAVIYVDEHLRQLQVAASRRLVLAHSLRLLAASLIALAAFFLSTPFAILDFSRFWQDMQFNAIHYARGSHGDFIGPWRVDGYLDFFLARSAATCRISSACGRNSAACSTRTSSVRNLERRCSDKCDSASYPVSEFRSQHTPHHSAAFRIDSSSNRLSWRMACSFADSQHNKARDITSVDQE